MNQMTKDHNQDVSTMEIKPNGLVISIILFLAGILFLTFAIFDKKADSDIHKFAIGIGIFMVLVAIMLLSKRNNVLLKLSPQGILTPFSDTIIPWSQVKNYQFTTLTQGFITTNCSLEIFLKDSLNFLDTKKSKYRVIYQPKKHRIFLSVTSFRPSISEIDKVISQYLQLAETKEY